MNDILEYSTVEAMVSAHSRATKRLDLLAEFNRIAGGNRLKPREAA